MASRNTTYFISLTCLCLLRQQISAFSPVSTLTINSLSPSTSARFASAFAFQFPALDLNFKSKEAKRSELKKEILTLASDTNRGLTATQEEKREMEDLFEQLEALNPTSNPLITIDEDKNKNNTPSVNGDWSLDYTTSDSILGKGGSPRIGPIVQAIDTTTIPPSAKNSEVVRYFGFLDVPRAIEAELSPVDGKFTEVQFKKFTLGPIGFKAPESFTGALDITYLDEEVRLTRGDRGNIFVLTRM
eukprot:261189_1